MDFTIYLFFAAIVLAVIGYLAGLGKISLKPILLIVGFIALVLPLFINTFIWIYVNSSPETVIPNVMGLPKEQAIKILEQHNLKGEVIGVTFSKEPNGTVVSQRPEGGRRVKEGRTINLIISVSEDIVEVPDILGKTSEEAYYILENAGLQPGNVTIIYSEKGDGYIIEQTPSAGNKVQKGTQVSVKILTKQEVKNEENEENN